MKIRTREIGHTEIELGELRISPGASERLNQTEIYWGLRRHAVYDWGNLGQSDRSEDDIARVHGGYLSSSDRTEFGDTFWISTDTELSVTTVMLPEEYEASGNQDASRATGVISEETTHRIDTDTNTQRRQVDQSEFDHTATESPRPYRWPINRLTHSITKGGVVTRIWQNLTRSGDVAWKIDQIRFSYHDGEQYTSHSLHAAQISDAIRGLCEAKVWIWKANRRLKRR